MDRNIAVCSASQLSTLQRDILQELDRVGLIEDTSNVEFLQDVPQSELSGAFSSLSSRELIEYEPIKRRSVQLTDEGREIVKNGSYEIRVFRAVDPRPEGSLVEDLSKKLNQDVIRFGLGRAIMNGILKRTGSGHLIRCKKDSDVTDEAQKRLVKLLELRYIGDIDVDDLVKQKHIKIVYHVAFKVQKGKRFSKDPAPEAADLTYDLIRTGSWRNLTFKKYNLKAKGTPVNCGALHPIMKLREKYRRLFLNMGFTEMSTNQYVELSLWNFDALFQAQDHPARDSHDTFFLSHPSKSSNYSKDLEERIRDAHEGRNYNTIGYKTKWDPEKARDLILRTHTTASMARMLHCIAKNFNIQGTVKLFSIDKVFRNEALDATHLAEFHQIEGVIMGKDITFSHLIGTLSTFFNKLKMGKLKFKPAYNPYTEPSIEIFSWHEGFNKYVEIGNSGFIRKEVLLPLGIQHGINVIAWGLSLERPTMIKYGLKNIRDLVGHKCDIDIIRNGLKPTVDLTEA